MEQKNNAKCPFCGTELYVGYEKGSALCTNCKKQFDIEKALKLLKSVEEEKNKEEVLVASGEGYLQVDKILNRAEYFIEHKQFEKAKIELNSALEITNTDYRVYFSLVRAETKNLTDYKNESHKPYLEKAITCADFDEKAKITRLYKDFYQLSKCSDEDIEQYKKEENAAIKTKLEKAFKEIIPFYMKMERGQKINLILFPTLAVLGLAGLIVGLIIIHELLMLAGSVLCLISYFFGRNYFVNRRSVRLFNGILDFYDQIPNFEFSNQDMRKVLDSLKLCAKAFAEKHNEQNIDTELYHFAEVVYNGKNDKAREYLLSHAVLKEFCNYFIADEVK